MLRSINRTSIIVGFIIILATAWTMFVASRLLTTYAMQMTIRRNLVEIEQLKSQLQMFEKINEIRLTHLEREILGERGDPATSQKPSATRLPAWDKRRDDEFRKRISSLELWRLKHDNGSIK